jgi:putative ABC transport system permease protein
MSLLQNIAGGLRGLFRKEEVEQELDEELRGYLDACVREKIAAGMSPAAALRAARQEFGNLDAVKEDVRAAGWESFVESFRQDLRFGARLLRKSPGFTIVAVLTLALGIGATTSVFSVVDRILFRSLPYPQADRLMSVGMIAPAADANELLLGSSYLELRDHPGPFESVAAFTTGITNCDLTVQNPVRLNCARVASTFLSTFGIQPLLGSNFGREEDVPNAPKVALVSYGLWQSQFGGERDIVGKTIPLDGQPTTVLGILPREFEFPTLAQVDVLIPQALDEAAARRSPMSLVVRAFGRLRPGVSVPQAIAALQPIVENSLQQMPAGLRKAVRPSVRPLRTLQVGNVRLASWVLLGAVLAVFLIACTNVANLLLARAASRREEFAIRTAFGAGHARLLRQNLTESATLVLMGGGTGLGLASGLLRLFIVIAPQGIPRLGQASLDLRVLLFTLGASIAAGIGFGLASVPTGAPAQILHPQQWGAPSRNLLRMLFTSAQIAISIILLCVGGLLLRSLWNLEKVPLGMNPDHVLTATIVLGKYRYATAAQQFRFFENLEDRIRQVPGVAAFSVSDSVPLSGSMHAKLFAAIEVEGRARSVDSSSSMVAWRSVTPGYFGVLGIDLRLGRSFNEQDRDANQKVIILSNSLAQQLFPNEDPLGKNLRFGIVNRTGTIEDSPTEPWLTVIGVAEDVKNGRIAEEATPEYYVLRGHAFEDASNQATLMIRSPLNPQVVSGWMHDQIAALDPALPVTVDTMNQRVSILERGPRFYAVLLALFAGLGVFLAAIGTYGVIAFLAAQRTHEIGVRMALGARRGDILRLILGEGLKLVVGGIAAGLLSAGLAARLMKTLLFGVAAADPVTFTGVTLLLLVVALTACYIPARHATRIDPMIALRHE